VAFHVTVVGAHRAARPDRRRRAAFHRALPAWSVRPDHWLEPLGTARSRIRNVDDGRVSTVPIRRWRRWASTGADGARFATGLSIGLEAAFRGGLFPPAEVLARHRKAPVARAKLRSFKTRLSTRGLSTCRARKVPGQKLPGSACFSASHTLTLEAVTVKRCQSKH